MWCQQAEQGQEGDWMRRRQLFVLGCELLLPLRHEEAPQIRAPLDIRRTTAAGCS
jgi:hypothetical protein